MAKDYAPGHTAEGAIFFFSLSFPPRKKVGVHTRFGGGRIVEPIVQDFSSPHGSRKKKRGRASKHSRFLTAQNIASRTHVIPLSSATSQRNAAR